MSNSILSKRYAKAVFELALESKSVDKVQKDFVSLQELLKESQNLREAVQNPVISKSEQHNAMLFILKKIGVNDITEKFIKVLIDNGRLKILYDVASSYFEMVKEHNGEVTANIISAKPLLKKQITDIEKSLSKTLNKTVTAQEQVDEAILGGIIVRVGSKMIDASVSGGLEKLKVITKQAIAG
ncbi:MAG: F0F1 ATP synthase subunit delta [Rickettsiales bacterium]|nr:F0F1 ATP synthase subunit delta [Pseudomonadota bacterium]MDA0965796.1 F0F1 ATP synthase subunit delta [Pseudomonadota bacterium]MDG4543742.1 F0F1 ATP synthase subunit delta [Rickettsiales bacterium]MDG4545889.1 F0F1 ATP synthase subunit delta [Rickettsiales bacterium]MDG4548135.1 F0F1 ATP synthase subunit delta [Rickettsiales bacterium]